MRRYLILICLLATFGISEIANAKPQWLTLPPTPALPIAKHNGYARINGVRIWYAEFGHGQPVILLHGGLANSNYWGKQVPTLAKHYRVIVMDSRGHGRSTHKDQPYSYDLMASDVIGLMDSLKIKKAAIVGWSDGAILGLNIAIYHPERLTKLFAFAANSNVHGIHDPTDAFKSPIIQDYLLRAKKEYEALSPTKAQYQIFYNKMSKMWETQPNFTKTQLNAITVPIWIVGADHDELIKRENIEFMAAQIKNAGLLIQPEVSHFSFLQDPEQFNSDVLHFLKHVPNAK